MSPTISEMLSKHNNYDLPKVPNPTIRGRNIFCNMFATYTSYATVDMGNTVVKDSVTVSFCVSMISLSVII